MHCHSRQNSTAPHGANGRNNSQYCCANNVACFSGVKTDATTPNKTTRNNMQQTVQTDATCNNVDTLKLHAKGRNIVGYTLRCCLISHFLEDGNTIQPFFYFSSFFVNLDTGLLEFIFRKTYQHLANWTTWNISDEFWNSVNSLLLSCSNLLQNFWWNHRKCRVHYVECMQNAFCASLSILL